MKNVKSLSESILAGRMHKKFFIFVKLLYLYYTYIIV